MSKKSDTGAVFFRDLVIKNKKVKVSNLHTLENEAPGSLDFLRSHLNVGGNDVNALVDAIKGSRKDIRMPAYF